MFATPKLLSVSGNVAGLDIRGTRCSITALEIF